MRRGTAPAPVAVLLALLLAPIAGCSLGEKEGYAERITAAPDAAVAAGSASLHIDAAATFVKTEGLETTIPEGAVNRGAVQAIVDFRSRRAALRVPGAAEPFVIVDNETVYVRRTDVPPTDARPWASLDLKTLDDAPGTVDPVEISPVAAVAVLPPFVLVDLFGGALTGSVERTKETATGFASFSANIDLEKAVKDTGRERYPEDVREAFEDVVALIGLSGQPHKGRLTIDDQQRPSSFSLRLRLTPGRFVKIDLVLDAAVTYGGPVDIVVPERAQLVQVAEPSRLLRFAAATIKPTEEAPG